MTSGFQWLGRVGDGHTPGSTNCTRKPPATVVCVTGAVISSLTGTATCVTGTIMVSLRSGRVFKPVPGQDREGAAAQIVAGAGNNNLSNRIERVIQKLGAVRRAHTTV